MVDVLDSFDATIHLDKINYIPSSHTFNSQTNVEIDNNGYSGYKPKIEITTSGSVTLDGVFIENASDNSQRLEFSTSLVVGSTDTLTLNFEEQKYTLNGNNILDYLSFPNGNLIEILPNKVQNLIFYTSSSINVTVYSKQVSDTVEIHYIEDFSISKSKSYKSISPFNSIEIQDTIVDSEEKNFSISKMAVNWDYYDAFDSGEEYRIRYEEYNPETFITYNRYLTGINFTDFERSLSMTEFIITDISGTLKEIY